MLTEQRSAPRIRRQYVNTSDALQRRYWCTQMNCTDQQLREAVWEVGAMVEDVRRYLRKYLCIDTIDQRRLWCRQLECTETQLFDAVTAVGLLVEDVRRYLAHRETSPLRRENWARRIMGQAIQAA